MPRRLMSSLAPFLFLLCCLMPASSEASVREAGRRVRVIPASGSGGWPGFEIFDRTVPLGTALGEGDGDQGVGTSLLPVFQRLADSSWSSGLHESRYAYDLIESVHVWTLCLFFGLTVMFDLRLLGWTMRRVPVSEVSRRLLPWTIAGFAVMVTSGVLLFSAIPLRSYQNIFFRAKMLMLLLAGLNVWIFHSGVYRRIEKWDLARVPPRAARVAGALSLVLWIFIVLSGRMIAYNWFDCDRQPQRAIVNLLTSCVPNGSDH